MEPKTSHPRERGLGGTGRERRYALGYRPGPNRLRLGQLIGHGVRKRLAAHRVVLELVH